MKTADTTDNDKGLRGYVVRLYPTQEQEATLRELQEQGRIMWNYLVRESETAYRAALAYGERVLGTRQAERPNCDGMSPEATKAAWAAYREAAGSHVRDCLKVAKRDKIPTFRSPKEIHEHFKGARRPSREAILKAFPGATYRDSKVEWNDYDVLEMPLLWACRAWTVKPSANFRRGILHSHKLAVAAAKRGHAKPPRTKRSTAEMPLKVRAGHRLVVGYFGDRRGRQFYNCQVDFEGLKIRGRMPGREPGGRVLEGVTIRHEADGWYASVKVECEKRVVPVPTKDVIGLDVGLVDMVAFSEPVRGASVVPNKRNAEYIERIAGKQQAAESLSGESKRRAENSIARLQQRARRHAKHEVLNRVVIPLAAYRVIGVEALHGRIGQMGGTKSVSVMRTIVQELVQRYGSRVREVDPRYTSQTCSQCGHVSKETWSYHAGRHGQCPACGLRMHRDVNAARNIAARALESLASS